MKAEALVVVIVSPTMPHCKEWYIVACAVLCITMEIKSSHAKTPVTLFQLFVCEDGNSMVFNGAHA